MPLENLAAFVAEEQGVELKHVMLLKHNDPTLLEATELDGGLEDITAVQRTNGRYDYEKAGEPRINLVIVVVGTSVASVYRVGEILAEGQKKDLVDDAHFEISSRRKNSRGDDAHRRFELTKIESRAEGCNVPNWAHRTPCARSGTKTFKSVQVELPDLQTNTNPRQAFRQTLQGLHRNKIVFHSPVDDARYAVVDVDDRGAFVDRLTAKKGKRISLAFYERWLERVGQAGGTWPYDTFAGNTVLDKATLLQGPDFVVDSDRKTVRLTTDRLAVMDNLLGYIRNLNVDRSPGWPRLYKPTMLAAVIEAIDEGNLTDNRIEFDKILPGFQKLADALGLEAGDVQAAHAFARLTRDWFWQLAVNSPKKYIDFSNITPGSIRKHVQFACLRTPYWNVLQSPTTREQIYAEISRYWFDGVLSREPITSSEENGCPEGAVRFRLHRFYERDGRLVEEKKRLAEDLTCEACGFDFAAIYGERGVGFIECHHDVPISESKPGRETKLSELSLLCANCHRIIHRTRPWLSVAKLKALIDQRQSA